MSDPDPDNPEPFDGIDTLLQIAGFAGSVIRFGFEHLAETRTRQKQDQSPVSWSDLSSDAVLIRLLQDAFPDAPIYSEESLQPKTPVTDEAYWLVDPLDCTREFLKGTPHHFCVTFAKIEQRSAVYQPTIGVIYDPISDEAWVAAAGMGSWYSSGNNISRVTATATGTLRVLIENASSDNNLVTMISKACGIGDSDSIRQGSALKCRRLLHEHGSFYIRPTPQKEWDVAALSLICKESSMFVSDFLGNDLQFNSSGWTLPHGLACLPDGSQHSILPQLRQVYATAGTADLTDRQIS